MATSKPLFETVGEQVANTENDTDVFVDEIDSLCMNCHEDVSAAFVIAQLITRG